MKTKKRIVVWIMVLALCATAVYIALDKFHSHEQGAAATTYICPMHPQITQDKPGTCPICGMNLVPVKNETKAVLQYTCPMHPQIIQDKPGTCPICGMNLVPVKKEAVEKHAGRNAPEGLAPVSIDARRRALLGITFRPVQARRLSKEIRTSVKIQPDETRQYRVTSKVEGWVEKLYVNQTGQYARRGAPLLSIYSPELLAAQQEYVSALRVGGIFKGDDDAIGISAGAIAAAARERLLFFGVSNAQIERIARTGAVERGVILYSPAGGYVAEKMVLAGQKIMTNDALMLIVDLSRVWGEADIYEEDIPHVRIGMAVEITLPYWPDKTFKGRISFLNPFLSAEMRTLKARIEIPNAALVLKPNMYGHARLAYSIGRRLSAHEDAVLRTGDRDYVFVYGGGDEIVPREVKVGLRSGDGNYEIISGLKSGEKVVTSANFLVDSESSLRAAFKAAAHKHSVKEKRPPDRESPRDKEAGHDH